MAEAAATADDEEKPVVRSAGLPVKLVILIAGGTLVLGLIGTFAYFKFSGHKEEASAEAAPHGKEETSKEHGNVGVPGAMFDLDPFIVNLSDVPESRYLKLTVKLELDRPDIAAELSARRSDSALVVIRLTIDISIERPLEPGLEGLKEDCGNCRENEGFRERDPVGVEG